MTATIPSPAQLHTDLLALANKTTALVKQNPGTVRGAPVVAPTGAASAPAASAPSTGTS